MTRKTFSCPMVLNDRYLFDIECDLDCSIEDDNGTSEPYLRIHDIIIDGQKLPRPALNAPTMWQQIAEYIRKQAGTFDDLFEEVAKEEGWQIIGGYWRLPKNYYDAA